MAALPEAYDSAREFDCSQLQDAFSQASAGPVVFVGSGGTFALAKLAADVFTSLLGRPAVAATPLQLLDFAPSSFSTVIIFSARANNPDIHLAAAYGRASGGSVYLMTNRDQGLRLPGFSDGTQVIRLPVPAYRDGFLATQTVISTATVILKATGVSLPESLPAFEWIPEIKPLAQSTLIAYGPGDASVAFDLEARLAETGLSSPQIADYRNLAHGRHVGLSRRRGVVGVVAVIGDRSLQLADATLSLLPDSIPLTRIRTSLTWPVGVLDLLVQSMSLTAAAGAATELDLANPRVPTFGRNLYHLTVPCTPVPPRERAVTAKLRSAGIFGTPAQREGLLSALDSWAAALRDVEVSGVVLDYDGTVCATHQRYALPSALIRTILRRLLKEGFALSFASGRGLSLVRDLRSWLPRRHWEHVWVGLYNGAILLRLDYETVVPSTANPDLRILEARLSSSLFGQQMDIEVRPTQISLAPKPTSGFSSGSIASLLSDVAQQEPPLDLKVVQSGHSVDIIPRGVSKASVVRALEQASGGSVVVIGDQGHRGGNDYELLASTPWSLSVDTCSGDPTRCWNVSPGQASGPDALAVYLRALHKPGRGYNPLEP